MKCFLLIAAIACQRLADDPQLTAQAWNETLHEAGQAYCDGELSVAYYRSLLGEARRDLAAQERDLVAARFTLHAQEARDALLAIARIDRSLAAGDRDGACEAIAQLDVPRVALR